MASDAGRAQRFLMHLQPLQGALEAHCRAALFAPSAVEDVLQNAVADAFRDFHLYVENTNFRAWIFRYLTLEILENNRRFAATRERQALPSELPAAKRDDAAAPGRLLPLLTESPDAVLEHCDEALAEAVRALNPQDAAVLLLRAIGEFKYGEIAEILEVPIGTVMSSLSRSREKLKLRLAEFGRERGFLRDDT